MILFNAGADNLLTAIKEKPFKLEKDIQRLFELNLKQIMGLELVKSEFSVKNKCIDTLAFDPQSKLSPSSNTNATGMPASSTRE